MSQIFSPTEERLRSFIERLSEALTEEVDVVVAPGDSWAAYPHAKPPKLTFRLADVAVMLETMPDQILSVTAHEIAHLLYTEMPVFNDATEQSAFYGFDTSKKPRAAHMLLNAVEDSRIERVFSDAFPGARSLFDRKSDDVYDYKVQRGFPELPIKWRYILNIDRVLHGLEPWGDDRDLEAVEKALDACIEGMWAESTHEAAQKLRVPYLIMLELMKQEQDETLGKPQPVNVQQYIPRELLEQMGMPTDYEPNAPLDDVDDAKQRSGNVTEHGSPAADADDHKVGGEDGGDGKREKADGKGSGDTGKGQGEKSVQRGGGEGGQGAGGGESKEQQKGSGGEGDLGERYADLDPEEAPKGDPGGKATNIIEEMVAEELAQGSRNKTVDILSYRQRHREREAKEIEKKMRAESDSFWDELNKVFEQARATEEFKHRMRENEARYARDRAELSREIATLKGYARNVLRDNAMRRFAGNHTSGRKIKTHRLSRIVNDDPRIFEKQEQVGGKSYAICLVVDQSASMRGASKQELAYKTSLVFLEAFDELVETSVIGFSDIGFSEPDAAAVARYAAMGYSKRVARQYAHRIAILHRTYKGKDDPMRKRWCVLPELDRSYSSTPMEAGVDAAVRQLRDSDKDVKVIIVITDGQPNDPAVATKSLREAQRLGIETYGLCIGGRGQANPGIAFLARACDHAVPVESPQGVPQAVYRLLRGVIRARRAA